LEGIKDAACRHKLERYHLASKVFHFFKRKKKLEKIVSLEEFGRYVFNK
jgi:hypothetical protein